jgi:hypothetical protein
VTETFNVEWKGDMLMMSWKGFRRKRPWPNFRYYPNIRLVGLRKSTKSLSQSPGRDLNLGPPDYEAVVLTTQP